MKLNLTLIFIFIAIISFCQESKIQNIEINSKFLKEKREITIYTPKDFDSTQKYNVIYCTDGQFINEQYKNKLDSLFSTKTLTPLVIIGINSNEQKVSNKYLEYRNYEYLESMCIDAKNDDLKNRFKNHLDFFVNEVTDSVQNNINLKINKKFFYGVSNGAAFGISLSIYHPDIFEKYILYSIVGSDYNKINWDKKSYPFFIISFGDAEPKSIINENKKIAKYLTKNKYKHTSSVYNGGHLRKDWLNQFIKDIELL